jgi:hypothetical protein
MRVIAGSAVAVAALLVVSAASARSPALKQMVIQRHHLPVSYRLAAAGYVSLAAAASADRLPASTLRTWGYVSGYHADFEKAGGSSNSLLSGVVEIDSSVTSYRSAGGATASFSSSVAKCNAAPAKQLSTEAKIGDETILCSLTEKKSGLTLQTYALIWRDGKLKGMIQIVGLSATTSSTLAVSLAKAQDKRMR